MALSKNKPVRNPNRRPMCVEDMGFAVSADNKRVLKMLEELERKEKGPNKRPSS
ncbi:hypothetical protein GKZ89_18730 [Bacillus mangrovi]|uniref:Uncharacterized protein n=1 Tax=Metabacillus mangrovi TaxID=1491830 RepID=A0A7X2SAG2_9BACI|nr:hypothetical protein [Metabacillus mangrovi]MTH55431.1 hypothetical protein [Metabacillus mangrovi]